VEAKPVDLDRHQLPSRDTSALERGDLRDSLIPIATHCQCGAHPEHFHAVCTASHSPLAI